MITLAEGCFVNEADVETALEMDSWGNGDVWYVLDKDFIINGILGGVINGEGTPADGEGNSLRFRY